MRWNEVSRWDERARCRTLPDTLFFGPDGETPRQRRARERAAVAACHSCPVLTSCREYAMTVPERYGVWGGTTERERLAARRSRTAA